MPTATGERAAGRPRLDSRDQTRRVPHPGAAGYQRRCPLSEDAAAIESLPVRSCFIDGEAIVVDQNGLSVFDLIRYRQHDHAAVLRVRSDRAGRQRVRHTPIEERKRTLAKVLNRKLDGITLNARYDGDGAIIFKHACKLGCEGNVSKRIGSRYKSGRSEHWLKDRDPPAPAVKREAEEDCSGKRNG